MSSAAQECAAELDNIKRSPIKSAGQLEGPWGVFPFFDSEKIIASDGLNGLVVMKLLDNN